MKAKSMEQLLDEAEHKAIDSLSRYKFMMFGYWAAAWIHANQISGLRRPNPFKGLVGAARIIKALRKESDQ